MSTATGGRALALAKDHSRVSATGEAREEGVVLTDLALRPIAIDSGAATILNDVSRRNGTGGTAPWSLPREITEAFRNCDRDDWYGLRVHFRGQRYEYRCSLYRMDPANGELSKPMLTLFMQRGASANNAILQIASECCLTPREEEVLTGISIGLTSKEVAQRLNISPNTVKTYLRLIMVKLGVTTRAAIVGRLLHCETTDKVDV